MKEDEFKPKKKEDIFISVGEKEPNLKPKNNTTSKATKQKLQSKNKTKKQAVKDTSPQPVSIQEPTLKLTTKQKEKLSKLRLKAGKAEERYCRAEDKLPTRQKLKALQKAKGEKAKVSLHFEEEIKVPKETLEVLEKPKTLLKQGVSSAAKSAGSVMLDGGSQEQSLEETSIRKVVSKGADMAGSTAKDIANLPASIREHRFGKYEKTKEKAVTTHTKAENTKFQLESKSRFKNATPLEKQQMSKPASNPLSKALQKRRFANDSRKSLQEQSKKKWKIGIPKAGGACQRNH